MKSRLRTKSLTPHNSKIECDFDIQHIESTKINIHSIIIIGSLYQAANISNL